MRVKELWIYPIKSLAGVPVQEINVNEKGLERDRQWMLCDSDGKFISQREYPELNLLGVRIYGEKIVVYKKDDIEHHIIITQAQVSEKQIETSVWKSKFTSFVFMEEVNQWFSDFLGTNVLLVSMSSNNQRTRSLPFEPKKIDMNYADGYPILVAGTESFRWLNEHVDEPVDPRQFRANIIIETTRPFEEDEWKKFNIGTSTLRMIKPCKRCVMITINQDTGEKSKEPLTFLSKNRTQDNKVIFGMNAAYQSGNSIKLGDTVHLDLS